MNPTDFRRAAEATRLEHPPADARCVAGLAIDCEHYLRQLSAIGAVAVAEQPGGAWQVQATCWPVAPAPPHAALAADLEHLWVDRLCYRGHELHAIELGDAAIVLEAITWVPQPRAYRRGVGFIEGAAYSTTVRIEVDLVGPAPDERAERARRRAERAARTAAAVERVLANGHSPNARHRGRPLLVLAAEAGSAEAASNLLDAGAAPAAACPDGTTALWRGVACGHPEVARLLLDHGMDSNSADGHGCTLLMLAAHNGEFEEDGYVELVGLLLGRGAAIDAKDANGWTALTYAASAGHAEIVRMLCERGANVNHVGQSGVTPLIQAARHGHLAAASILLEHGADTGLRDRDGRSAGDHAARRNRAQVAELLEAAEPQERQP